MCIWGVNLATFLRLSAYMIALKPFLYDFLIDFPTVMAKRAAKSYNL